jgi:hypothetical protein
MSAGPKVRIRLDNLPDSPEISVLDAFSGDGATWNQVRAARPGVTFDILPIDVRPETDQVHLVGDNLRFLAGLDLRRFDVIDLDAWGYPVEQLRIILSKPVKPGVVLYVTLIEAGGGALPRSILADLGYTRAMVAKCRTLFAKNGQEKLFQWLAIHGIRRVKYYCTNDRKKTYLATVLGEPGGK